MTNQVIHDGRYRAEYLSTARGEFLIITRPKGGGRFMEGDMATEWAYHIKNAGDKTEKNALCRAIINSD